MWRCWRVWWSWRSFGAVGWRNEHGRILYSQHRVEVVAGFRLIWLSWLSCDTEKDLCLDWHAACCGNLRVVCERVIGPWPLNATVKTINIARMSVSKRSAIPSWSGPRGATPVERPSWIERVPSCVEHRRTSTLGRPAFQTR